MQFTQFTHVLCMERAVAGIDGALTSDRKFFGTSGIWVLCLSRFPPTGDG